MSRDPLVGVTTSITVGQTPERAYVNSAYLHAVQQAGGVPVLLPPQLSKASLERLVRGLDALLLTGGGDVDPATFGEEPHPTLYEVAPARDALETQVTLIALERKTPLLAICRGILPVAWAPDKLVEGVELDDDSQFVLGVQWHPEHLVGNSEPARRLFSA